MIQLIPLVAYTWEQENDATTKSMVFGIVVAVADLSESSETVTRD